MPKQNIELLLENQRLRKEFDILNLDIAPVFEGYPEDMEIENRRLKNLLVFVEKYLTCEDQKTMELMGYMFPPIFPGIGPDSDWYRFKRWMANLPVRETIVTQLGKDFVIKASEDIADSELPDEIERLILAMAEKGYYISLVNSLPDRLVYDSILEWIGEKFDLCPGGGWHLDGCTGYCPDCIQRPWCEAGQELCWPDDKEAGKMALPKELKGYVSASPNSLDVLLKYDDNMKESGDMEAGDLPF